MPPVPIARSVSPTAIPHAFGGSPVMRGKAVTARTALPMQ